jgi:hypothetical protein
MVLEGVRGVMSPLSTSGLVEVVYSVLFVRVAVSRKIRMPSGSSLKTADAETDVDVTLVNTVVSGTKVS